MAASKVSIANQALSWLGANKISAFSNNSTEAGLISTNYDGVRDAVLEDRAWTFATRRVTLSPLLTPPVFGYTYQFQVPSDLLRVLEVREDGKNSGPNSLDWSFEEGKILANAALVYVRYIASIDDPLQYSAAFVQCFAARLAADLAIPIASSRSLQQDMWGLYQKKLADAKTTDGMQGRAKRTGARKFNTVRGATGGGSAMGPTV